MCNMRATVPAEVEVEVRVFQSAAVSHNSGPDPLFPTTPSIHLPFFLFLAAGCTSLRPEPCLRSA